MQGPDPAEGLVEAADAFAEFKADTKQRLDTHDENFEGISARLRALEQRSAERSGG